MLARGHTPAPRIGVVRTDGATRPPVRRARTGSRELTPLGISRAETLRSTARDVIRVENASPLRPHTQVDQFGR